MWGDVSCRWTGSNYNVWLQPTQALIQIPSANKKTRIWVNNQSEARWDNIINSPAPEKWEKITNYRSENLTGWIIAVMCRVRLRSEELAGEEWFVQTVRDTEWCCSVGWQQSVGEVLEWSTGVEMEHQIRDHCSHWGHWVFQTLHWWWGEERPWWEECRRTQVSPALFGAPGIPDNFIDWYLPTISIYTLLLSPWCLHVLPLPACCNPLLSSSEW